MEKAPNPYQSAVDAVPPLDADEVRKNANRAAILAALGVFLFPLFGLAAWFFGRTALRTIQTIQAGHEHRAAAQLGIVAGWISVLMLLLEIVVMLRDW